MNHIESAAVVQTFSAESKESLSRDLCQAIKIINADYQEIDWEDQLFLNRVLSNALQNLEVKEIKLCR